MSRNDTTLVILAGGEGTRMRPASLITPKPLLSTFDEPLLIRQIRQANEVKISNILVSTNPKDFNQIQNVLSKLKTKSNLILIKNSKHAEGSLPALAYSLNKVSTSSILMSFADIYFTENPFFDFQNKVGHALGFSKAFNKKELSLGGIIFIGNKQIEKIIEKPIANNTEGYRWNGLAIFNRDQRDRLINFLRTHNLNSPEGDFFEYLRVEGEITFLSIEGPDFINVNRPENLLVASMYRFAEVKNQPKYIQFAKQMRRQILKTN